MLEIGSLVDGKYKILNEVGHGGMSIVYLAMNEKANKQWAIKEVRKDGVKQIDSVGLHGECLLDFATYDAMKSGFGKVVFIIRKDIEAAFRERLFDRIARNFDAEYVFQQHESLLTAQQIQERQIVTQRQTAPQAVERTDAAAEAAVGRAVAGLGLVVQRGLIQLNIPQTK